MKKMLLLLVCLTTFAWLHADEVTIDFSKQGYSSGQKITDVKVNDYINITFAVGTGNNDPIFHTTGNAIRFYGGNTMTVSCKDATLKEIVFTTPTSGSGSTFNKAFTSTLGTFNSTTKTWIGENVVSTQFNNGTSNSTAQVRIISLKITYTISGSENQASTPSISPASGAVEAGTKVTISCSDAEAEIHYTTNGDDPTAESAIYTAETDITVNEAMTVKAIAVKKGLDNSEIATATYTIKKTTVADIAEFISLAEASPVDEYAIANPVTAVYQNGQNLYVKDSSGWLLVFGSLGKTYANGDVIAAGIKGKSQDYNGTYELSGPVISTFADGVAGTPVEPEEVSNVSGDIVNHYVVVKGVTISDISKQNGKATTSDATEIALYNKFNITGFEAGSNLTVKGFVNVYRNTTIQLIPIEITTAQGEEIVAAPTFSLAAGNVAEGTEVSIACATEGATIHYTTDGTDPDANSAEYTEPIAIDYAMTIKAIAVKEGMSNSDIVEAAYKIIVATPTFDPAPGAVKKGTEVTITCATGGATLMYQVNGGDIQEGESPVTVVINEATTIEVIASKEGYVDSEAKVTYSIEGEAPANPTATFDFTQPGNLQPAFSAPTFAPSVSNPAQNLRVYVDGAQFYNNYALVKFNSPSNAQYSNRTQLWNVTDGVQLRTYNGSTITITTAESLTIEKVEFISAGSSYIKIKYNGTLGSYSVSEATGTWTRGAANALAAEDRESITFDVTGTSRLNSINVYTSGVPTGVEDVTVDENAPVEYYNLQGVRVANPENGIYIRRQGSKVSKVLVK